MTVFRTLALLVVTTTPALGQDADITAGKKVFFNRCISCHQPPSLIGLTPDELAMNEAALPADASESTPTRGPSLTGLIGRKAGTLPDYAYSDAMRAADVIWTAETLKPYLLKPSAFIPRNKMPFNGLKRPGEVDSLIAYLADAAR
jgi:cytochrome c2